MSRVDGDSVEVDDEWERTTPRAIADLVSSINSTNDSSSSTVAAIVLSPYYQHSFTVAAVYTLAYLFIFLLCMTGNGLVCLIVLKNHHMRTVTNLFILNLAISDLLVGIFCIPTTLVDNLITGWPFSNAVCKLSGFVQGVSVCASVFTLVAIAVDSVGALLNHLLSPFCICWNKFRCIVYPFKPKLNLLVAKATIGIVWLLAFAIMFPSVIMLEVKQENGHYMVYDDDVNRTSPLYYCYETWPNPEMRKIYTTVLFVHIYLLPLTLIILLYICIGAKLYTTTVLSHAEQPEAGPGVKPTISHRKVKVIKMLILVALLFMLSWLPLWTLMLLTDYARPEGDRLDLLTAYVFPFSHWLAFSNSSVNPIIYGYFNENFRRGFQAACQPQAGCLELQRQLISRKSSRQGWAGSLKDTTLSNNPISQSVRNRIYTESNSTKQFVGLCLELASMVKSVPRSQH
uniref:G-protein coupled receptors family 1 profile domain-containing protein n=1 Tax=Denticeps clupeoides TaxID=299321 RepID=A0AAY4BKF2_9TELE